MTFYEASIQWQKVKADWIKSKTNQTKRQLNLYVKDEVRQAAIELVRKLNTDYDKQQQYDLAIQFEQINPAPHSKDY